MGNLIFTCSSSSRGNTSARITDSSTWYPQPDQHISIRTFRELNQARTSSPTWRRTGDTLDWGRVSDRWKICKRGSTDSQCRLRRSTYRRQYVRGSYSLAGIST
ncbi:AC4 [Sunn hemp leaf distortion virus [India:Barrackpore2:2008]]|nr:AC4 [Sunn hemp leaf distortion virus [India:Barrackpore2:2008]]ACS92553.1 AC4 [Sunn hemp leaf distortion virus [India:Barrackpore3:2008]]